MNGTGPIAIENPNCSGKIDSMSECGRDKKATCGHDKDVFIQCKGT